MKNLLLTFVLCSAFIISEAQLTVSVPTISATPGQTVYIPVTLSGASSSGTPITSANIQISYNNTVLTYVGLVNFYSGTPSGEWIYSGNIGGNGIVAANWLQSNLLAIAIPDNTALFQIQFTYNGGTSPLTFTLYEFTDVNFDIVPTTAVNGSVGPPGPATYTWTGSTNTNWTTAGNWNPVRTSPATTDILQFNLGGTIAVTNVPTQTIGQLNVSNSTTVNLSSTTAVTLTVSGGTGTDMTIPEGSSLNLGGPVPPYPIGLTINSGCLADIRGYITVSGALTNNAGTSGIVIQSDVSGSGSLIDNGTINGGATVERYLAADIWHYISSPISDATIGIFFADYLRTSDPSSASGWGPYLVEPVTIPFEVGRGYAAWLPAITETKLFAGNLNTGTVSITLSRNASDPYAGWHLAGNPYPSAIDLSSPGMSWGQFENTAWFWTGSQYETYPVLGGYGTHSQYVPAEQGFYAHINSGYSGNTALTFNNTARTHSTTAFYKEMPDKVLAFTVEGSENGYYDKGVVHFIDGTTPGYDPGFDAIKLFGVDEAPQVYTTIPDMKLTVNSLPWTNQDISIPLNFQSGISEMSSITFSEFSSFPSNIYIYLEDVKVDHTQDLKVNPAYNFNYSTSDDPARFILHFTKSPIGIRESEKSGISIYSNNTTICIKNTGAGNLQGEMLIYDLLGREAFHSNLDNLPTQYFTPGLSQGYYIVHVITQNKVINKDIYLN